MARDYVTLFGGKRVGWIETAANGDKTVYNWAGLIVSRYNKAQNMTYDFYGKIIATGDVASGFLLLKNNKLQ